MKPDRMAEIGEFLEKLGSLEAKFGVRVSWNYHQDIPHLTVADSLFTNEAVLGRDDVDGFEVLALNA